MTSDKMKILQVTSKLFRGGAESFIMNVYRNIDRSRYHFDFLVFHDGVEHYESEIESLGGKVYHVPVMERANLLRKGAMLSDFFCDHGDYDVVHGHMAALGNDYFRAAKKAGIARLFAHSHVSAFDRSMRGFAKRCFERNFGNLATRRFACSQNAGEYAFGNRPFEIVKNGIDVERFRFRPESSKAIRRELGISERTLLIGHVGRFEVEKNHRFLIDIFGQILSHNSDAKLVLVGDGSLREAVESRVCNAGLSDSVTFSGTRDDVHLFYSAMDLLIMPSFREGLPFTVMEAQCAGVPCLLSTAITQECRASDLVSFLPLSASPDTWANEAVSLALIDHDREECRNNIKSAGYCIEDTCRFLEEQYAQNGA